MGVIAESQFRSLVEQHQSMVYSIALRIAGDRGAAEEIAQDAFLELYAALKKMESEDHVRFWLRRVTANRATDWLRRKAVRPDWSAEQWDESYEAAIADRVGGAEVRLEQMVSTLPEVLRGAVVLRYQEDLEPDEIATLLGQPVATVKSNLQRALGLLRRKADVMLKEFKRERVG
ncbi:RNA polymerase sigma factor [Granulicella aggregans]|uniref:RNA polymerase sigma factor n=1 Tax=Granulicella aggregans TaxID=474949 RepID=UPI0021E0B1F0|nr:RNA polymerase sigma factor [Granulicella aggregans]